MTEPVTPAAPAAPAASAAPAAPAPATPTASLLPDVPAAPVAPIPPAAPAAAAPPATPPAEWFLAEGVKGTGAPPDWYKAGKYKTVDQQAKAYGELEKRFGAFTGAPEGEYEIKLPDQYKDVVQVDTTNPVFSKLGVWAKSAQLSQDGYNNLVGLLAEYEASVYEPPPTAEEAKKLIGANADTRLQSVGAFATASLDAEGQKALKTVLSADNKYLPQTMAIVEALMAKSRQPALPNHRDGGAAPPADELKAIDALQAQPDPKTPGRRLYETDPNHRNMVEQKRREYFARLKVA